MNSDIRLGLSYPLHRRAGRTADAVAAQPAHRHVCGDWQDGYTALHQRILTGKAPARYAVARGIASSGLADTLIGTITVFLFALLTDRAFQVWHPELRLEDAYSQPSVNWTHAPADEGSTVRWMLTPLGASEQPKYFTADEMAWFDATVLDALRFKDPAEVSGGAPHIEFVTHFGLVLPLFDNPFVRRRLYQMGLRPDTAFGCAFNYLFEPHAEVLKPYAAILREVSNPHILKIGVHIRLGDEVFGNDTLSEHLIAKADPFLDCAQQIESSLAVHGQPVKWILFSDSTALRQHIRAAYPGKVVTPEQGSAQHVLKSKGGGGAQSVRTAVAENWLLGQVDAFVLTAISGFGRIAVFRSLLTQSAYIVADAKRTCGVKDYDSWRGMAEAWGAGI